MTDEQKAAYRHRGVLLRNHLSRDSEISYSEVVDIQPDYIKITIRLVKGCARDAVEARVKGAAENYFATHQLAAAMFAGKGYDENFILYMVPLGVTRAKLTEVREMSINTDHRAIISYPCRVIA